MMKVVYKLLWAGSPSKHIMCCSVLENHGLASSTMSSSDNDMGVFMMLANTMHHGSCPKTVVLFETAATKVNLNEARGSRGPQGLLVWASGPVIRTIPTVQMVWAGDLVDF